MRRRAFLVLTLGLCLSACAQSAGESSAGIANASLAAAYLPLAGKADLILDAWGAATMVAPGIAATNAHNANLVAEGDVVGVSHDYDLLFFRTAHGRVPPMAQPWVGEMVVVYGQGLDGTLRQARGIVRSLSYPVIANCADCPIQQVLAFEANAGKGFSGGPVADAVNGRLLGIVFGFDDRKDGSRLMFAYDTARVLAELSRATKKPLQNQPKKP